MPNYLKTVAAGLLAAGTLVWAGGYEEAKLQPADVPAPVADSLTKHFPNARVAGWTKEVEDGKTMYEASIRDHGAKKDVSFGEDGALAGVEETITLAALPEAVKSTVKRQYPAAVIRKAEKVSQGTGEMQYEVTLGKAAKKEVTLTAEGKVVKEE